MKTSLAANKIKIFAEKTAVSKVETKKSIILTLKNGAKVRVNK